MHTPAREDLEHGNPGRYRAIWRWHFYAGLLVAPVLVVLAVTGAAYLFDREFESWWYRDVATVAVGGRPLSLAAQERIALAAHPGSTVAGVRLPRAPDEAFKWSLLRPGGDVDVFVDPYRGVITGTADPAVDPMAVVRKLHGSLLAGNAGGHVVELVACWTLVLLATGLYLWWPRRWQLRGVVVPRLGASGRRLWRDLHAIPSLFNAVLVAFLVLTGLPWSTFWGVQFARLGEVVPFVAASPNFTAVRPRSRAVEAEVPPPPDAHAAHRSGPDQLPWVIQQHGTPVGGHGRVGIERVEQLLPRLDVARHGGGVRIFYPDGPGGVFTVSHVPDRAQGQRTFYVDPADGRVLDDIGWRDYSAVAKAVEWGVMTHMGRQYGLVNQIIGVVACVALVGTVVAGVVLWWRRRPEGALGAPPSKSSDRLPRPLVAIIAALALLLPLVGLSLVVVLAMDRLLRWGRGQLRAIPS
jgi:uncharacterized iron-regulated membrane protein